MEKFKNPKEGIEVGLFGFNHGELMKLMPRREDIPEYEHSAVFKRLQSAWFFSGLGPNNLPVAKAGINSKAAWRHLSLIQRSFDCKHEHKSDAVAYLMSLWFEVPGYKCMQRSGRINSRRLTKKEVRALQKKNRRK